MRTSKIFGERELEILKARFGGKKADKTGLYSRLVKPKVKEILEWFKMKKKLERLLINTKKKL